MILTLIFEISDRAQQYIRKNNSSNSSDDDILSLVALSGSDDKTSLDLLKKYISVHKREFPQRDI